MNKAALFTTGKKLNGSDLYLLSVYDLEPSGIIIHAYNQSDSKEYMLPVTEMQVFSKKQKFCLKKTQSNDSHTLSLSLSIMHTNTYTMFFFTLLHFTMHFVFFFCFQKKMAQSGITRSVPSLTALLDTIFLAREGKTFALQSTNANIRNVKRGAAPEDIEPMFHSPIVSGSDSLHALLVTGLVELCKVKPVGLDAVQWLGEWLLANNPNKPRVDIPDDEE